MENVDSYYPWSKSSTQAFYNLAVENPFPLDDSGFIGGVMIEVFPDKTITSRVVYSFSDWFSDVGGFLGSVQLVFIFVMPLF